MCNKMREYENNATNRPLQIEPDQATFYPV